ncbi:MAG TPA: DNA polymerase III subunit epsilon [Spongiibacteraceae bacterium]|nr:DNA polymerase III subunit epsilon [Spongiibacteraceae bacterium]
MRQIVLDTETTGLEHTQGHRLIEVGCVELVNRKLTGRHFHTYINPEREVEAGAIEVHGITNEMLADKPLFRQVVDELIDFIRDAELIIHNAPFDIGFLNSELSLLDRGERIEQLCGVIDTLVLARQRHPGQKNNLDALCQRYGVDNSQRDLHGALLDAEILADVYLAMTGGQTALALASSESEGSTAVRQQIEIRRASIPVGALRIVRASADEIAAHAAQLERIDKASSGKTIFKINS